jgi:hypothetical protein
MVTRPKPKKIILSRWRKFAHIAHGSPPLRPRLGLDLKYLLAVLGSAASDGDMLVHLDLPAGSKGWIEALPNCRDHLVVPVPVQRAHGNGARDVGHPHGLGDVGGGGGILDDLQGLQGAAEAGCVCGEGRQGQGRGVRVLLVKGNGRENVADEVVRQVAAVDEAGAGKGDEQDDAVEQLKGTAGELELIAEPVDVEKGGGEFVEDEAGRIVVDKGSLRRGRIS